MRKLIAPLAAAAAALLLSVATVEAQQVTKPKPGAPGQWRLIGHTQADHGADHDVIVVQGPYDNFRKIKFKVTDAGLNMQYMLVTYDNGGRDRIEVKQNIPKGGESRAIDLKGAGTRSLRKIEFWYDTKGFLSGKADVTVFGQK